MSNGNGNVTPPERKTRKGKMVFRSLLNKTKVYFIPHALDRTYIPRVAVYISAEFSPCQRSVASGAGPPQSGR